MSKGVVHALDWLAAIVIAIALTPYLPGAVHIYNVVGNIWGYTIVVMAGVSWALARVLFGRLRSVG